MRFIRFLLIPLLATIAGVVAYYGLIAYAVAWFNSDSLLKKIIARICWVLVLLIIIDGVFRTGK
ncbi:hypothetical protein [Lachnobacterium bovis]|uniref:hypothetical protein n=1 Tax=Lachnobacterium bovis TaxID=140626 RepID=UPI0003B4B071|nr:hypothetical protein [Lachnobacterium bovis]